MKKSILHILFICLLFSACEKKTLPETNWDLLGIQIEDYNRIDTVFYDSKKIKTIHLYKSKTEYTIINYYESGNNKSIGKIKDNQCHDVYIDWYENGKQKWIRKYDIGKQIGKSIFYNENGNPEKENDNNIEQTTDYWRNGKPKFKYIENVSQSYHYYNGNFMEKYTYTNYETNEYDVAYYHENGKLAFSGQYKKDTLFKDDTKYNGEIICYFDNGKTSLYQNMNEGKPIGKFYGHYGNGNLKYENETKKGKETYYKSYFENGKVHFIKDPKTNTYTQWDEKGNLIENEKL